MTKTLILNFPPLDKMRAPLSGAIISNICKNQGHEVMAVDLQFKLDVWLKNNNINLNYFDDVFYENSPAFNTNQLNLIKIFILEELKILKVECFDYILCSFFSYLSQQFGKIFLSCLRPQTNANIVIGGAGIKFNTQNMFNHDDTFAEKLKKLNIIDEYIIGEAEVALVNYFKNGHGPGIGNDNFVQIDDLDSQLIPDYSFYNLSNYSMKELTIVGSRGCVRNCTFCDIVLSSPKYRYRSGKNIAQEIITHYEKHGVTNYYFADSLINGSYKAFNEMCEELIKYKFDSPLNWSGQYIIRDKKSTPKNHFEILKSAGCKTLYVGIESGCDRVRFELGKKFTNDDIEYYLENFNKNDIQVLFLFFSGYVSETEEDHKETLLMFDRWKKFVASGTIQGIETLNILSILTGSPLEKIAKDNNFLFLLDENNNINPRSWINPALPNFDFKERVRRHIEMIEEAMRHKWPLWNGPLSMDLYERSLIKFLKSKQKKYIPITQV